MLKQYLIGNWKSNKTIEEAKTWLSDFELLRKTSTLSNDITLILCAPFTALPFLHDEIQKKSLPIFLGAQDVSVFEKGAYTGEINADMLKGLVSYVLIGHSERRRYFHENDHDLGLKAVLAKKSGIQTIYCVEGKDTIIPSEADIVAYEPVSAIGSGKAEDQKTAEEVCSVLKTTTNEKPVLYGGSVTEENGKSFLQESSIDGLLVGGVSLDAKRFLTLASTL